MKGTDMLKTLTPLFGAVLLAATTALYAQTTPSAPADAGKGAPKGRHYDCSQAKDPKACEERRKAGREKMKAAHEKARHACESKKDGEHRDCMRKAMCAESKDPVKCEARFKERSEAFKKGSEACKDKTGDERKSCMRAQRGSK
jgi:Spy/CpxP family protein refolding chaperone